MIMYIVTGLRGLRSYGVVWMARLKFQLFSTGRDWRWPE